MEEFRASSLVALWALFFTSNFPSETAFSSGPEMKLQDLSRNNIRSYVEATLEPHLRMETAYDENEEKASHIIQDIIKKANGVLF